MHSSPMNGVRPPFELPSGIVYFHDWRYVDHGYLRWLAPDQTPLPLMPAPDPFPAVHADSVWLPKGIRIETVPGRADQSPVLRASELHEDLFFGGSVIRDGGMYRLFYESLRPGYKDPNHDKVLRYAESNDGLAWHFPNVNAEYKDNIVFDPGSSGYHGGAVFRDEHGPADERYKSIWLGHVSQAVFDDYRRQWPDDIDPMAVFRADHPARQHGFAAFGVFGATSPDGFTWRKLEMPLLIQHSDTFNACMYDPDVGSYVLYPRTWFYDHRSVGRAVSPDFRHFTNLQQVLWPDPGMRPTDTWYTPGYTRMPGAPDCHLMFATQWSQIDDSFTPILHTSADGILWNRVPGPAMLEHGPTGSWYACGGALSTLVELPQNQMGSLMMGWHVPHKYPRVFPGFGQAGWVRWDRGRLTRLRADEDAEFRLYPLNIKARRMILNYRTQPAGSIQVGVRGTDWLNTVEECDPITGNEFDRVVTWNGSAEIGQADEEPLQFHFRMRTADLFSVRFE